MQEKNMALLALAIAGFAAIVVGVYQDFLQVAPGYQGTVGAGAEALNRKDWLLVGIGIVGIVGAAVSHLKKRLSFVPAAVGAIVLLETFRTSILVVDTFPYPLYTETAYRLSGDPVMFIFGAKPFLLVIGGILLVGAGIVGLRGYGDRKNGDEIAAPSSRTA